MDFARVNSWAYLTVNFMSGKHWKQLFNPGGGLRYHARALLYRDSRWMPFRQDIRLWLEEWIPRPSAASQDLLVIAPSGGHCLPSSWLGSFRSVSAVDIDPLAPLFFRLNHAAALPSGQLHWIHGDVFQDWQDLIGQHPHHLILFGNFLGQAQEVDEKQAKVWFDVLAKTLGERKWASFHDRYSGVIKPIKNVTALETGTRASSQEILKHFYAPYSTGELCEHELPPIFPEQSSYRYWSWPLSRRQFHIIEGYHC
ncbi:MAG: hypothetical protein KGQ59_06325 [Bdellovibrionales bacterium]|nr:hypothetical protein [Bdellovibrionales bacterium]